VWFGGTETSRNKETRRKPRETVQMGAQNKTTGRRKATSGKKKNGHKLRGSGKTRGGNKRPGNLQKKKKNLPKIWTIKGRRWRGGSTNRNVKGKTKKKKTEGISARQKGQAEKENLFLILAGTIRRLTELKRKNAGL